MALFVDVFNRYVRQSGYTSGQISKMSRVPKATIDNWLNGRVKKPRVVADLLSVMGGLHIDVFKATEVLEAAGYPTIKELQERANREQDQDLLQLLTPWQNELTNHFKTVPFQAIADLPNFVGREAILKELKEALLQDNHSTLYCLEGMGGVGKTSLATRITYELKAHFSDGVLWARLDVSDTMSILGAFADAYERDVSQYKDLESRGQVVRDLLAKKQALVILDNAQRSEDITPLLPPTGQCAVLVTTRHRNLAAIRTGKRFVVPSFDPSTEEALALFRKILGHKQVQEEQDTLLKIADLLEHLPLAVDIVASRMAFEPNWSATGFHKRLERQQRRLNELAYDNISVHLSFDLSFDVLASDEQIFFANLGAFSGDDFDAIAAAYVSEMPIELAEDHLRKLYGLSLVQGGRQGRYRIHRLLQSFARNKQVNSAAVRKMTTYYINYISANKTAHQNLDLEISNILVALETAFDEEMLPQLIQGISEFYPYLELRGLQKVAVTHLLQAEQSARALDDFGNLGQVLLNLGKAEEWLGSYSEATRYLNEGLILAKQQGLIINEVQTLAVLASVERRQGDYDAAQIQYHQALNLLEPDINITEEVELLIQILNGLGTVYRQQSNYTEAKRCYEDALNLSAEIDDLVSKALALNNLGIIAFYQRKFRKALSYHEQALLLRRRIGDLSGEGVSLMSLAQVNSNLGDFEKPEEQLKRAWSIQKNSGNRWEEGNVLNELGVVYLRIGDLPNAQSFFQQSLDIFRKINDTVGQAYSLGNLGIVMRDRGDLETAQTILHEGKILAEQKKDKNILSFFLSNLGVVSLERKDFEQAVEWAHQALQLRQELKLIVLMTAEFTTMAVANLQLGNKQAALEYTNQALKILNDCKGEGPEYPERDYFACYKVLSALGERPLAIDALQSAYDRVMAQAEGIKNLDLRQDFLDQLPINHDILKEANQNL